MVELASIERISKYPIKKPFREENFILFPHLFPQNNKIGFDKFVKKGR